MRTSTFVLALGGSIIYPEEIDVSFLRDFYRFVKTETTKGRKFIIIVGGGSPARKYQEAAEKIGNVTPEDEDWIGIHATRLNAHLLRTIFRKEAHPVILKRRGRVKSFGGHSVIIGAGWQPGWSTDYVAVQTAIDFKIKEVIVLGKAAYVYTADFEKDADAKPISEMRWQEYRRLIPGRWSPGLHTPVDPLAARLAQEKGVSVIVADGGDLKNLKKILRGQQFKGTLLSWF